MVLEWEYPWGFPGLARELPAELGQLRVVEKELAPVRVSNSLSDRWYYLG